MSEYQKRVVAEAKDLGEKIQKFRAFISSDADAVPNVDSEEYIWMQNQLEFMHKYYYVLKQRINLF